MYLYVGSSQPSLPKNTSITTDIPDSPTALMPQPAPECNAAADDCDVEAIKELNTKRLSTVDKVHEWLKCVGQQQPKSSSLAKIKQLLAIAPVPCVETMSKAVMDVEKEVVECELNIPQVSTCT